MTRSQCLPIDATQFSFWYCCLPFSHIVQTGQKTPCRRCWGSTARNICINLTSNSWLIQPSPSNPFHEPVSHFQWVVKLRGAVSSCCQGAMWRHHQLLCHTLWTSVQRWQLGWSPGSSLTPQTRFQGAKFSWSVKWSTWSSPDGPKTTFRANQKWITNCPA